MHDTVPEKSVARTVLQHGISLFIVQPRKSVSEDKQFGKVDLVNRGGGEVLTDGIQLALGTAARC